MTSCNTNTELNPKGSPWQGHLIDTIDEGNAPPTLPFAMDDDADGHFRPSNDNDCGVGPLEQELSGRALFSVKEARQVLGCSKTLVYELIAEGRIRKGKLRGKTVLRVEDVRRVLAESFGECPGHR